MSEQEHEAPLGLEEWGAMEPPAGFVGSVMGELARQAPGKKPGRGVVVPLLLAALLMSGVGYAAWHSVEPVPVKGGRAVELMATEARDLRVQWSQTSAHAEPERGAAPQPADAGRLKPRIEEAETEEKKPVVQRKVHLPSCECGVAASICSCVDTTFVRDRTKK